MKSSFAVLLAVLASASAYDVVSLTADNYAEMTDGKTVFIKFFAPWVSPLMTRSLLFAAAAMPEKEIDSLL
jgi:hypothetical protein